MASSLTKYYKYILIAFILLNTNTSYFAVAKRIPTYAPPATKKINLIPSKIFPASTSWEKDISLKDNIACILNDSILILSNDESISKINIKDGKITTITDERFKNTKDILCQLNNIFIIRKKDVLTFDPSNYLIETILQLNSSIVHATIANNILYILTNNSVSIYDTNSKTYYNFVIISTNNLIKILPYNKNIILISSDGKIVNYSNKEKKNWFIDLKENITTEGTIFKSTLYQTTRSNLYAIDLEKHKIKWKLLLGASTEFPPIVTEDSIFLAPINNLLLCLDHKGNKKWIKLLNYKITTQMLLLDEEIVVSPFSKEIMSVMTSNGNIIGTSKTNLPFLIKSFHKNNMLFLLYANKILCLKKEEPKQEEKEPISPSNPKSPPSNPLASIHQ